MTSFRIREGLTIRALPDGDAVVAASGSSDAVIINSSAHAIVELLQHEHSASDIANLFREVFPDQDPAAIERDVSQIVQELVNAGIVEPCGNASSTA